MNVTSTADLANKIVGTAHRATAAVSHAISTTTEALRYGVGILNAIDLLIAQHKEVFPLFDKVAATKDIEARKALCEQLCDSLICHMRIEEEIFYPAAMQCAPGEQAFISHSEDDHMEAKRLMAMLLRMSVSSDEFDKQLAVLSLCIRQHKTEEEEILLPLARKVMPEEMQRSLADKMHERFHELLSQGKPRELVFRDIAAGTNAMGILG
jgi:hemerythrin-like domain-containing protein